MSWLKIDDQFPDHPKVVEAGPLASWLHVCGMAYCARYLTDGFIPGAQIRKLADVDDPAGLAEKLVKAGLWDRVDAGFQVCGWLGCCLIGDQTIQKLRKTREYRRWRKAILKRDRYACQSCGSIADPLHAHHILPWARHLAVRYALKNGITLCVPCHKGVHQGGWICPGEN